MARRNGPARKEKRYRGLTIGWALALIGVVISAPCSAQSAGNEPRAVSTELPAVPAGVLDLHGQVGASINNLGVQQSFDLSWHKPLSASRRVMLSGAHVAVGGSSAITPAHVRAGAWVEVAPLSVFVVRAGAEPGRYFGTFNSLTSFDSRGDAFDTDSRRERGGATVGTATRLYVTPRLQFRAGRVIGAATADLEWWSSNAAGPFFYEPTRDTLLDAKGDRLIALTNVVLYEHPLNAGGFSAGLMHSRTRVNNASLNEIQRVGVLVIRQFEGHLLGVARPSFTGVVSRYLDDPSKRGEWAAAMAIGFSLNRKARVF
jgi:hypothetical protein